MHVQQRASWLLLLCVAVLLGHVPVHSASPQQQQGVDCWGSDCSVLDPRSARSSGARRRLQQSSTGSGLISFCSDSVATQQWLTAYFDGIGSVSNVALLFGNCQQLGVATLGAGHGLGQGSYLLMSTGNAQDVSGGRGDVFCGRSVCTSARRVGGGADRGVLQAHSHPSVECA